MTRRDPRRDVRRSGLRQHLLWASVLGTLLLLLSFFSAGFFLYSALVVAALFGLTTAMALAGLLGLEVRRRLSASEIELGQTVDVRLTVANRKELPAPWLFWEEQADRGLDVEGPRCAFKSLKAGEEADLDYRLHSLRRGFFRVGPAVVETGGPFGLVRRFLVDRNLRFVTVLPKSQAIGGGWPLGHRPIHQIPRRRSLFEDPTRFIGTRDYRPGDPQRRIHWRATARSQKIQVKLYEPAVLEGALVAVEMDAAAYPGLDAEAEGGDPRVELTVTAAAAIAEFVLAGDQRAGLLANGTDAAERFGDWTGGSFRRLEDALEEAETRRRLAAGVRPSGVRPSGVRPSGPSRCRRPRAGGSWRACAPRSPASSRRPAAACPICSTRSCRACPGHWC